MPSSASARKNAQRRSIAPAISQLRALTAAISSASCAISVPTPVAMRQLGQQRQQQASGARADVEDAQRPLAPTFGIAMRQRRLDQRLAIGARVERRRRQRKASARRTRARRECATRARARSAAARAPPGGGRQPHRPRRSGRAISSAGEQPVAAAASNRASRSGPSTPACASSARSLAHQLPKRLGLHRRTLREYRLRHRHGSPWPRAGSPGDR